MSKFLKPAGGKDRCDRDSGKGKDPLSLDDVSSREGIKQADAVQVDSIEPRIDSYRKRFTGKAVTVLIGSKKTRAVDDQDIFASGQFCDVFANYCRCAGVNDRQAGVPVLEIPDQGFKAFHCTKDDVLFDEECAVEIAVKNSCRVIIAST